MELSVKKMQQELLAQAAEVLKAKAANRDDLGTYNGNYDQRLYVFDELAMQFDVVIEYTDLKNEIMSQTWTRDCNQNGQTVYRVVKTS